MCPNCNNKKLIFRNLTVGYRKFCSKKCSAEYSHKDSNIKEKRIKNMLKCNYDLEIRKLMTLKANETKKLFSEGKKNIINAKRKNTVNEKYGVNFISQNKEISAFNLCPFDEIQGVNSPADLERAEKIFLSNINENE